ncbi:hypothetical protein HPB50_007564 [Hyalomma asiaticum]|uniref:Uncharacterized protein n=1 Tax=Hyalomma asiaticum TaxID=266040 RepID=A0ACB7TGQ5_HYAAI|nr:hypothetical protein HPB50_007564 [Hyalomma asiaticum]
MDVDGAQYCQELFCVCRVPAGGLTVAGCSDVATDEDCVGQGGAAETAAVCGMLGEAGTVPDSIYLHDYMDTNADVIAHKELNNGKILKCTCATVTPNATDTSDDEVPRALPVPVTASQVMDPLDTL